MHAPILKYPDFSPASKQFQLYTDASATGIGAVLEQCGHFIAYISRIRKELQRHTKGMFSCCTFLEAIPPLSFR